MFTENKLIVLLCALILAGCGTVSGQRRPVVNVSDADSFVTNCANRAQQIQDLSRYMQAFDTQMDQQSLTARAVISRKIKYLRTYCYE